MSRIQSVFKQSKRAGFALLFCVQLSANAQPAMQWRKAYLGEDDAVAYSVGQGGDEGFICGGWVGQDGLFLRVREDGSVLYQQRYPGRRINKVLVDDWSYMVAGDSGNCMFFADAGFDGDLFQLREFPGTGNSQAWDFIEYVNRYWLVGHTEDTTRPGELDGFVIESDWEGNILTRIVYGGQGDCDLRVVVENNWGVWHAGWTVFDEAHHAWTVRWRGGNNWSGSPWAVSEWNDMVGIVGSQHLVRVGHTITENQKDVYVSRCGEIGSFVWDYVRPGAQDQDALSVVIGHNGGFVVAGYTEENENGKDILLFRLNNDGTPDWETILPMQGDEIAESVAKTTDGGYVVSGSWTAPGVGHRSPLLVKFCPPGSDAGQVVVVATTDSAIGYRLMNESGSLDEVRLWGMSAGTPSWITGEAVGTWIASWQNDTLGFQTNQPLTTGSIDTFWVTRTAEQYFVNWRAGCRTDTTQIWTGSLEVLSFSRYPVDNAFEVELTVQAEQEINYYEIYGVDADSFVTIIAQVNAINQNEIHTYTTMDTTNFMTYHFVVVDTFGSQREYPEWVITPPFDNTRPNLVSMPVSLTLETYPNPFNSTTEIRFDIPRSVHTSLRVYDVLGREVKTLLDDVVQSGTQTVLWNAEGMASGIYFVRLQAGGGVMTKKVAFVR